MNEKDAKKSEGLDARTKQFIVVTIGVIFTFGCGFLARVRKEEPVTFTKSDITAIEQAFQNYGDDIVVWKNKDGELIINLGERR